MHSPPVGASHPFPMFSDEQRKYRSKDSDTGSISFRCGNHVFSIPWSVINGTQVSGSLLHRRVIQTHQGSKPDAPLEVSLERNAQDFGLMVDHLLDRKPLEVFDFSTICTGFQRLMEEMMYWGVSPVGVELPTRMWTKSRWTDLGAFYWQSKVDQEVLKMKPVACALDDGRVQGIMRLNDIELDDLDEFEFPGLNVKAAYGRDGYVVVVSTDQSDMVVLVQIKVPSSDRVIAYEVGDGDEFPFSAAPQDGFPFVFRRYDRHFIWVAPALGVELQEVQDGTGGSKYRCLAVSKTSGGRPAGKNVAGGNESPTASTVPAGWNPLARTTGKRPDLWMCVHPELGVALSSSMKLLRDLPDVTKVRFYPWGSLILNLRLDPVLAVLSIDQPEIRRTYGEKLEVVLKNYPSGLKRSEVDVCVTPNFDRVYILACGQVGSVPITSTQSSKPEITFEFATQLTSGRAKLKFANVDISEGAPRIGGEDDFHCLGLLSEFDTSSGLYYQNSVCSSICLQYSKLASI